MQTDILVFHGATDAPTVDVAETAVLGGATLVNDLSYGELAGYLEVPTGDYTLGVRTADVVSLYPNPANNAAELVLQGAKSQRMSLQVADVAGRMVMDLGTRDLSTNGNSVKVDVSSLAPGSYRLLISTTDASTSLPLQVVR